MLTRDEGDLGGPPYCICGASTRPIEDGARPSTFLHLSTTVHSCPHMTCGEIDHSPRQRDQATSNLSTWTRHVDHPVLDSSHFKSFADHSARSAQATLPHFPFNWGPKRPAMIGGYGVNIVEDTFRGDFGRGVHQQSGPEARPRAPRWSNNVCFFFSPSPFLCRSFVF